MSVDKGWKDSLLTANNVYFNHDTPHSFRISARSFFKDFLVMLAIHWQIIGDAHTMSRPADFRQKHSRNRDFALFDPNCNV